MKKLVYIIYTCVLISFANTFSFIANTVFNIFAVKTLKTNCYIKRKNIYIFIRKIAIFSNLIQFINNDIIILKFEN